MKCGVVIGSYNLPQLVRLQIHLIRHHCGPVPILIADDCSDGFGQTPPARTPFGQLQALVSEFRDVLLWPNVARIGHTGGDMAAFWRGIVWGKALGLDVVAKLSCRVCIDLGCWLQDGAEILLRSGLPIASNRCEFSPIRTEACLLAVDQWHQGDILAHLTPRPIHHPTEQVIWDDVRDRLGGMMFEWGVLPSLRRMRMPYLYTRWTHGVKEYGRLAERYGVRLDRGFHTAEWKTKPNYLIG